MDLMYQKMKELDAKMEELQQVVHQLSEQISRVNSHPANEISPESESDSALSEMFPPTIKSEEYTDLYMEHKDILVGGNSWQYNSYRYKQMGMTAEVEIRRLTAQLTAAYNRIAALEEQLFIKQNVEHKLIRSTKISL